MRVPCSRAASSSRIVPSTFTSASKSGRVDRDADVRLGGEVQARLRPRLAEHRATVSASRMSAATSSRARR